MDTTKQKILYNNDIKALAGCNLYTLQLIKEITVDGVIYKRNEIQNSRTLKVNRADSTHYNKIKESIKNFNSW